MAFEPAAAAQVEATEECEAGVTTAGLDELPSQLAQLSIGAEEQGAASTPLLAPPLLEAA